MIELLGRKAGVSAGRLLYGTAFGDTSGHADTADDISKILAMHGFNYHGKDFLYSGFNYHDEDASAPPPPMLQHRHRRCSCSPPQSHALSILSPSQTCISPPSQPLHPPFTATPCIPPKFAIPFIAKIYFLDLGLAMLIEEIHEMPMQEMGTDEKEYAYHSDGGSSRDLIDQSALTPRVFQIPASNSVSIEVPKKNTLKRLGPTTIIEPIVSADQIHFYSKQMGFSNFLSSNTNKIWVFWNEDTLNLNKSTQGDQFLNCDFTITDTKRHSGATPSSAYSVFEYIEA
ncbi:unnamed protein product [Cuscuta campestris]|uniref:Uncharacterized protein n=1 Tax=Cuscuta campestris TaxID=132261 RepID=A0A484MMZ4_9ASTE|nr:unnamed protein product [Cuscuta campestris]